MPISSGFIPIFPRFTAFSEDPLGVCAGGGGGGAGSLCRGWVLFFISSDIIVISAGLLLNVEMIEPRSGVFSIRTSELLFIVEAQAFQSVCRTFVAHGGYHGGELYVVHF